MKYPRYPAYKDSGVEWIGEIPEDWTVTKLKFISLISADYGINISADNYIDKGVRFIRITDINVYFNREIKPFVPDAWINDSVRDIRDGKVGKVGFEIPFNRYFYKFVPPRSLEEIDADLKKLGNEIIDLLKEVTE